jgi:hypothetical protein
MKPVDAARDVTQGARVTVTLPRVALEVLAQGSAVKAGELADAQLALRAELASIGKRF